MTELFDVRKALVGAFLRRKGYDGILLSRVDNFAMATGGGRNYVNIASDIGACSLFITRKDAYYVGNTIEATRIMAEELDASACHVRSFLWFEDTPAACVQREFGGALVSDDGTLGKNVHDELAWLRALLTEPELDKYRHLGRLAAEAMTATLAAIQPGEAEADIAARLVNEGMKRRCLVPVALIAADERIAAFRHPLPTQSPLSGGGAEQRVAQYVMVVGCFVRDGLWVSLTRFKRTADLPEAVEDAYRRICGVDALVQEATAPGCSLGSVFAACQQAYAQLGFEETEWYNHHQGGATGYAARSCKGAPGEPFVLLDPSWEQDLKAIVGKDAGYGHALAWNPSAPGVKSEDTFLLTSDGATEIITPTPELPQVDLAAVLRRPTEVVKSGMAVA
jgi:Xaa-Pro aminopeptidase